MNKLILLLFTTFIFSAPAQALLEVRAGYGVQTPADDNYVNSSIKTLTGFNLDAIVEIPLVPVGLGLRYESMGFDSETVGVSSAYESSMERTSLLVNYRFIDLFAYFGLIGTVGLVNNLEIKDLVNGTQKYDASLTYSAGLEGGFAFGMFLVGAELGYMMANFSEADAGGTDPDFDVSGVYAKALVGLDF